MTKITLTLTVANSELVKTLQKLARFLKGFNVSDIAVEHTVPATVAKKEATTLVTQEVEIEDEE